MALGIVLMVYADLGVSPWDVLHIGLQKTVGLTIGIWNQAVGITLVLITVYLTRKFPGIGTILNMILVGAFVDLIMFIHLLPVPETDVSRWIYLIIGIALMGFGSGMYISSRLGAGPRDGLLLALSDRLNWSIRKVRTWMEVIALGLGWLMGGPVWLGTLLFTLTIGPIMQFFVILWRQIFERVMYPETYRSSLETASSVKTVISTTQTMDK